MMEQQIDILTLLRDHPFTRDFPEEKAGELAKIAKVVRFTAGQRIFEEGEIHRRLYLIVYGRVSLYFYIPGKGEFRYETVSSGEVLGWSSLVEPYKKASGAVAVENTLALSLDSEKLMRMMEEDTQFGYKVYQKVVRIVADRLRAARMRLIDIYGGGG
jgi:CRP/FNR family cyclic AMP-dependent transcriptional regulator